MRRIYLVTGGAGFIGSHLCEQLLGLGHAVRVVDNLSASSAGNLPGSVELLVGDAADQTLIARAVEGVAGIFHLAAIASTEESVRSWVVAHRVNQTAAVVALDAARAAGRIPIVLASSAAVYGDSASLPLHETAPPQPLSPYAADKLGSELHAHVAWVTHGVPTAALRLFNVFGPRQNPASPYSGVISRFADRLRHGQSLVIHGDGQQTRDFVYVSDAAMLLAAAMQSLEARPRALVCNVCTGREVSVEVLARRIASLYGLSDPTLEFAAPRIGDIRYSCGNPARAALELRLQPKVNLDQGLAALLEWSASRTRAPRERTPAGTPSHR